MIKKALELVFQNNGLAERLKDLSAREEERMEN